MADLAHDASGPASSEPAGFAPQQTGRPASSDDRGKLRVFISYSRDDLDFADQLTAALDFSGFECFIDRQGISGGEDWKRSLGGLISEADTVVFVLTPNSARSPICDWEVEEATRLNKRILPIVCRPLEDVSPPPRLRELNYIFFSKEPKVPGSGFGTGLAKLVTALNTDFDWLRDHTRYLQRAIEWDAGGRPANRLLSGDDIAEAKAWVARRPKSAPEPSALQLDFIRASEEEAETRLSEQRKQLDAMAAAQAERETALHKAEEAQHKRATMARIRNIALVVVSILAVLVAWFGWNADQQRKLAEQQTKLADQERKVAEQQRTIAQEQRMLAQQQQKIAEEQKQQADDILGRAENIIFNQRNQMDAKTQQEAFALLTAGAIHGDTFAMFGLGAFYADGHGVAQDFAKAREWLEKAAAEGNEFAELKLKELQIREAATAGRYAEALRLEEAFAVKLEAWETTREGKPGTDTANALTNAAWWGLFAKEFTKALAVADRGHALFPDNLRIEANRAHALMLMGHDEEAKALYLSHKGEPVAGTGKLWEQNIPEDFAEFRKAGLTSPMMADIEKELGISR